MATWSYADCLPYFKRMEDCTAAAPDDPWRGHGGPLTLERGPATSPLFRAWFAAAEQAGYPPTADVNGYRQEGVAPFDRNIRHGRRWSARRRTSTRSAAGQPDRPDADARDAVVSTAAGRSASRSSAGRRHGAILAGEVILAAARSTRRSC
jgi:choline dehydrogenase-like flavoprotein